MVDALGIIAALRGQQHTYEQLKTQAAELLVPGMYAWWLVDAQALSGTILASLPAGACLYVGISEKRTLKDRLVQNHFEATCSSKSAPRRSLGAVLREVIGLEVYARGRARIPKDFTHYQFDRRGEREVSPWLQRHVIASFWCSPTNCGLKQLEDAAVQELVPVLNDDSPHPLAPKVSELREQCKHLAISAGPRPLRS